MEVNLNTYQKDCLFFFLMGNEYLSTYCLKKEHNKAPFDPLFTEVSQSLMVIISGSGYRYQ